MSVVIAPEGRRAFDGATPPHLRPGGTPESPADLVPVSQLWPDKGEMHRLCPCFHVFFFILRDLKIGARRVFLGLSPQRAHPPLASRARCRRRQQKQEEDPES
ncbi:hypothetical protein [Oricola sp.]|uniref:hypothetical protein n=1 Tax=Oricola sp. TaxID=1979950 RepID=UPI0025E95138|nr:hypothetical protein [Oricola sp.]MCI5074301.1 hypothetical protein [Oricola sp.]